MILLTFYAVNMLGLLKVYVDVCGGQQNKPSLWFTSITTKVPSLTPEQVLQELPSAPFMMTGLKSVPEKSLALLFFDILKVLKVNIAVRMGWTSFTISTVDSSRSNYYLVCV